MGFIKRLLMPISFLKISSGFFIKSLALCFRQVKTTASNVMDLFYLQQQLPFHHILLHLLNVK